MEKIWYLYVGGQQLGPMSLHEAQGQIASGAAQVHDYAYRPGMENWQVISTVPELQPIPKPQGDAASAPSELTSDPEDIALPKKRQVQEDLSVLTEMRKDDFEERTGRIDTGTLKAARKEAVGIERPPLWKNMKFLLLIMIGIAILSYFAMESGWAQTSSGRTRQKVDRVDVEALKKKYWETGDPNEIRVVQNRLYTKSGKFEFSAFGSTVSSDPFLSTRNAGGILAFHLSEQFSLGVIGWKSFAEDSAATDFLYESTKASGSPQRPFMNKPESFYGGELGYSPIYGKLSLFGKKILHYDIHFMGGAGMTGGETGSYVTPFLGIGQKLYLGRLLALRLDYRYMRFREVTVGTSGEELERNNNTNVLSLGFSLSL